MNSIQRMVRVVVVALSCAQPVCAADGKTESKQTTGDRGLGLFHDYIDPLLKKHCYQCHSHDPGEAEGGLVLDSQSGWLKGGSRGPAIVSGEPEASLLIRAVEYDDEDLQMPPAERLADDDLARLRRWIKLGAPDPRVSFARTSEVPTSATGVKKTFGLFNRSLLLRFPGSAIPRDRAVVLIDSFLPGWKPSIFNHRLRHPCIPC